MSNGACKFSPFLKMSSTAGNGLTVDLSALCKLKHNLDNITSQKWGGARHIGEPLDHKCGGGLEPLGPIGVYAYARCDSVEASHWSRSLESDATVRADYALTTTTTAKRQPCNPCRRHPVYESSFWTSKDIFETSHDRRNSEHQAVGSITDLATQSHVKQGSHRPQTPPPVLPPVRLL